MLVSILCNMSILCNISISSLISAHTCHVLFRCIQLSHEQNAEPSICLMIVDALTPACQEMCCAVDGHARGTEHDLRYEWRNNERPLRYTDTRVDEQSRGISMKSTPMSLILEASNGKSFVMNMLDTPGKSASLLVCCHHVWPAVAFQPALTKVWVSCAVAKTVSLCSTLEAVQSLFMQALIGRWSRYRKSNAQCKACGVTMKAKCCLS